MEKQEQFGAPKSVEIRHSGRVSISYLQWHEIPLGPRKWKKQNAFKLFFSSNATQRIFWSNIVGRIIGIILCQIIKNPTVVRSRLSSLFCSTYECNIILTTITFPPTSKNGVLIRRIKIIQNNTGMYTEESQQQTFKIPNNNLDARFQKGLTKPWLSNNKILQAR